MRLLSGIWLLRATMAAIALLLLVKTASLVREAAAAVPTSQQAPGPAPATLARNGPPPGPPPVASAPPGQACPPAPSAAELALLGDLRARKTALDQRAAAIAAREQALAAAEKQFSSRMAELTSLQRRIQAQEAARQQAANADTEKLVKLYEAMKPTDAATIFDDLDRDVLLPVLDAMNVRRAAPILAAMKPERARLVTAELAAMRARRDALIAPATPPSSPAATLPIPATGGTGG